jgi:hypothetical protein
VWSLVRCNVLLLDSGFLKTGNGRLVLGGSVELRDLH